mmetsp:Transcript_9980/g.26751  ORF Transcript_9980/g.26751 Transcript_9980/m.26751 type:complete len:80 (-) Transcript_9980:1695-1934(-)
MTDSDAAAAVTNCKTTNNATIKIHLQRGTKKEIKRKKRKKQKKQTATFPPCSVRELVESASRFCFGSGERKKQLAHTMQ